MATTTSPPEQGARLGSSLRAGLMVAAVVGVAVFVVLAVAVWHVHGLVSLDGTYRVSLGNPRLERVAWLGSPPFVLTVAGLLAIVSWARRDRLAAVVCAAAPPLAGLCEIGTKHVVVRTLTTGLSYPSGHAALSAALATVVAVVAFRVLEWRAAAAVTAAAAVVPVVVSYAVVRLAWHAPTDVVGGTALGVAIACGIALLLDRTSRKIRTN